MDKISNASIASVGGSNLIMMASAFGTSIVIDECTANKLRVSYVRVLVEVDIT